MDCPWLEPVCRLYIYYIPISLVPRPIPSFSILSLHAENLGEPGDEAVLCLGKIMGFQCLHGHKVSLVFKGSDCSYWIATLLAEAMDPTD